MANTVAPIGFLHQGNTEGSSPTFGHKTMLIASDDGTALGRGDPLKMLDTGYVTAWTGGTAVSQFAGIFMGCTYQTANGLVRSNYYPGSSSGATGPIQVQYIACNLGSSVPFFLVQAASGTTVNFASIGQNADVTMGTPSPSSGMSGASLSGLGTGATLPFRIVGYNGAVGPALAPNGTPNDLTSAAAWVYVAANVAGAGSTGI